jgi:hypothetical protein
MPGQFVPSPKNRTPRRGGSRVSRAGREESGPLRGPRRIAARAMYKIPPRTSSAPSPIRNILGLSIYRCHAVAQCVFSGSTGSNWQSSMRRGPSGRRRDPPPTCLKLLPTLGSIDLRCSPPKIKSKCLGRLSPDMSEGAWQHSSCVFAVISIRYCQNSSSCMREIAPCERGASGRGAVSARPFTPAGFYVAYRPQPGGGFFAKMLLSRGPQRSTRADVNRLGVPTPIGELSY